MRADDPNLPILIVIVQALGDLKDEMVFVGGCAAGLLLTDPAVDHIRATNRRPHLDLPHAAPPRTP